MKSINRPVLLIALVLAFAFSALAEEHAVDAKAVKEAVEMFKQKHPAAKQLFKSAYAYAVFPDVKRGALFVGGAYGEGAVYDRKGKLVGRTTLTQLNVGFGAGGEAYAEVIFFENKEALARFEEGQIAVGARANAAVGGVGAAAEAPFENGVAVLTMTKAGLMADASVGGQRFTYQRL